MNNRSYPMRSDVIENEKEFNIFIELAGCKKEDIDMYLEDDNLSVNCNFQQEKDGSGKIIHRERFNGKYQREFYVGEKVNRDEISAKYENGILTITLPKINEEELIMKNRISIL